MYCKYQGLKPVTGLLRKPVKNRKFENRKPITAFSFEMLEAVIGYR
jgi:hypothetical protein